MVDDGKPQRFRSGGKYDASVAASAHGVVGVLSAGTLELRRGRKKLAKVTINGVLGDIFDPRQTQSVFGAASTCAFFAPDRLGVVHIVVDGDDAKIARIMRVDGEVRQISGTSDASRVLAVTDKSAVLLDCASGVPFAERELPAGAMSVALQADGVSALIVADEVLTAYDFLTGETRKLGAALAVAAHPARSWWAVLRPDGEVQIARDLADDPTTVGVHVVGTRALVFAADALVVGGQRVDARALESVVTYDFGGEG